MTTHSPLGASAAKRWSNCPGSVREIAKLPESLRNYESDYAKEGTAMHYVGEMCLNNGMQAIEFVGRQAPNGVEVTGELADYVQEYVDAVRFSHEMNGGKLSIEIAVAAPDLHKDAFGTLDADIDSPPLAHIFDLKGGEGLVVEAEGNDQFRQYAWMKYHNRPDVEQFVLTVCQPRREHSEGTLRSETLNRAELQAWAEEHMLPAMRRTEDPDAPLKAGEWCRFCPVNKALACPKTAHALEFMSNPPRDFAVLDDATLLAWKAMVKPARFAAAAVDEELTRRMMAGIKLPGFLLKHGKSDRVFRDKTLVDFGDGEVEVEIGALARQTFGKDALTEPKLKSPAQLEKVKHPDAKNFVAKYAYKPEAGLVVAEDDGKMGGIEPPKPEDRYAHLTSTEK